ncbi:MAG: tRNA (adenosine(37)-N6)-dimethylallyltransferase MiaA [Firmicutes bacterium]|nr:tRNA (adenosine(37)-N6)-dimethylallyltransferase MiaA [Bacillota bacterium]
MQIQTKQKQIIVLTGPTASGKSLLALDIACQVGAEIVCADSSTVYKSLDIGTAKPSLHEQQRVPHHLIDCVDIDGIYSVYDFVEQAERCIQSIWERGKQVVLVGGTGLFIKSLLYKTSIQKGSVDTQTRLALQADLDKFGKEHLYKKLQEIDLESANKLCPNDTHKVIRALEIYLCTGKTKTETMQLDGKKKYDFALYVLDCDRADLYARINQRVDKMMHEGLLEEVKKLYPYKDCQSMRSIGYKELIEHIEGDCSLSQAIDNIKQHTRNYAKRQLTFFRHQFEGAIFASVQSIRQQYEL